MTSNDLNGKHFAQLRATESLATGCDCDSEQGFLMALRKMQSRADDLLGRSTEEQKALGYFHTLHEILQQPWTWQDTCARVIAQSAELTCAVSDIHSLVLTGSGSSEYAGECVRLVLQKELGVTSEVVGGGALLTHGSSILPHGRPGLMVSLARSGDSPESVGALELMLKSEPAIRHLVLTCNKDGALASKGQADSRVHVIVLNDRTNDRSLAMTSSLTNMVLAARYLGLLKDSTTYRTTCERLGVICRNLFLNSFDSLADAAATGFNRVVYLGSGSRWGAARESALKMLEMTAGRVSTMSETWLGLRHGPMSYIGEDTLIVCLVSSDPLLRAYELDLLNELDRKQLGLARVLVGEDIPARLVRKQDVVVGTNGISELGDENAPVLDVVVGQLLAFNRCLNEGLRPDSPSEDGVINRVVESFAVYSHRPK